MADENEKKTVSDALRDWGIDVDKFEERAKESMEAARGDLSEVTGTLRHALVQAKEIVIGLQKNSTPVASELRTGFERAWHEIETAFAAARDAAKKRKEEAAGATPPSSPSPPDTPGGDEPPHV